MMRRRDRNRSSPTAAAGRRTFTLRTVLLLAAWTSSGLWSVAHVLEHQSPHDVAHHVEAAALALDGAHSHGHAHPELLSILAVKNPRDVESAAALTSAPELAGPEARLDRLTRRAPARAALRSASAFGPRAPPLS